jgi:hypothetical protein
MRHIIVAVLVMVVINAQLTWWIVFILRLNRSILGFERERLLAAARTEAILYAGQVAGDQGEQVAGLGKRIVPANPVPAIVQQA